MIEKKIKVVIVGAGPGDAGLITIKAASYLKNASYILIDRLVNGEIITLYANPNAQVIYVGKHGGQESTSQSEIDQLLIECANKAGLTVRLKGGDVAIFSNVLSEIEVLKKASIPFEVVPGITAVSGASASLMMPLTARGYSKGVRILSYYSDKVNLNWAELSATDDTLVFYMSGKNHQTILSQLRKFIITNKPVAIIEQATTANENIRLTNLLQFDEDLNGIVIKQPALIVIGEVVNLINKENMNASNKTFFREHIYAD